jgi:dephospho-CoA kinase
MLIAGLTGNFGMGKSYVLSVFRDLGAVTVESDRVVGMLLNDGNVVGKMKVLLGDDIVGPDGRLDKKAVASKIFNNGKLRADVEAFIHPLVLARIDDFISNIKNRGTVVIIEVPLLFEGSYQVRFKRVITVYTSEETALERLIRSGCSRSDALARLRTQLSIEIKKQRADYAIDNSGPKEETRKQVEKIYRLLAEEMERDAKG